MTNQRPKSLNKFLRFLCLVCGFARRELPVYSVAHPRKARKERRSYGRFVLLFCFGVLLLVFRGWYSAKALKHIFFISNSTKKLTGDSMAEVEKIEMATISLSDGTQMFVPNDEAKKWLRARLSGKKGGSKKTSVNGAPVDTEGYVVELVEGEVLVKHKDFKSRKFALDFATKGCELVAKEEWQLKSNGEVNKNSRTGTRFVEVEGRPFGENLAKPIIEAGILSE